MTEGAKVHLRNVINEALAQLQDKPTPVEMGNKVSAWWKSLSTNNTKCQKEGCHKLAICEGFCGAHCNCKT